MNTRAKRGMTLLEIMIAVSIFSVLVLIGMSTFVDIARMVESNTANTKMDQQANKALRQIAQLMRQAILPIPGDSISKSSEVYDDINDIRYGFGGSNGVAWRTALQAGADAVPFVVPIDAQRVGDFLDTKNHLQIGQDRAGVAYLGATPYVKPASAPGAKDYEFFIRDDTELVNALAAVPPNNMLTGAFATNANPIRLADWQGLYSGAVDVTSFMVVRFVPLTDENDNPLVIHEQGIFTNTGSNYDVDLDLDDRFDGQFNIGRLQLLYSGGDNMIHVSGAGNVVRGEELSPLVVNLTGNVVLRRTDDGGDQTPIFRLVRYGADAVGDKTDENAAGQIDESDTASRGTMALNIRVLMVDNDGVVQRARNGLLTKQFVNTLNPRWYETTVVLMNMDR